MKLKELFSVLKENPLVCVSTKLRSGKGFVYTNVVRLEDLQRILASEYLDYEVTSVVDEDEGYGYLTIEIERNTDNET